MFEQAVQSGEAMRESAKVVHGTLVPALSGCVPCGTSHMISAPTLGVCEDCGTELTLLDQSGPGHGVEVDPAIHART